MERLLSVVLALVLSGASMSAAPARAPKITQIYTTA
jgi:hypothetical protein